MMNSSTAAEPHGDRRGVFMPHNDHYIIVRMAAKVQAFTALDVSRRLNAQCERKLDEDRIT
jgi:hypothetical protein